MLYRLCGSLCLHGGQDGVEVANLPGDGAVATDEGGPADVRAVCSQEETLRGELGRGGQLPLGCLQLVGGELDSGLMCQGEAARWTQQVLGINLWKQHTACATSTDSMCDVNRQHVRHPQTACATSTDSMCNNLHSPFRIGTPHTYQTHTSH